VAHAFGLAVTVCHYPTAASNWNPIKHRLFSQITHTWAATPLTSIEVVLDGLRKTTTTTGLSVEATLIETIYQKGLSVTDEEMQLLMSEKHVISVHYSIISFRLMSTKAPPPLSSILT
jgi:hypothetical protein